MMNEAGVVEAGTADGVVVLALMLRSWWASRCRIFKSAVCHRWMMNGKHLVAGIGYGDCVRVTQRWSTSNLDQPRCLLIFLVPLRIIPGCPTPWFLLVLHQMSVDPGPLGKVIWIIWSSSGWPLYGWRNEEGGPE